MTCEHAIELLPWLLNDTLDQEAAAVRQHLESCGACREALRETRQAWSIFDQHLPTQTLVALSYGEPPAGLDASLVERHLASCPQCAAELELARMSRRLEEDDRIAVFPAKRSRKDAGEYRTWRTAALAAGLAGVVALGGWIHSAQRLQRIPELEARNQQIQQEQKALESQVKEAQAELSQIAAVARREPQINTWTDSVYVGEVVRGQEGREGGEEEIVIPSSVVAMPALVADPQIPDPLRRIVITDEAGTVVWSKEGLRRDSETNDFTVTFFPGFLKPGHRYTIQLYTPDGTPRETYKIRVE